jgi:hypothetical protein
LQKERGLEATELGSVYGKWEARYGDTKTGNVGVRVIEMKIRVSHGSR